MSLSDFLSPVNLTKINPTDTWYSAQLGAIITIYTDDFPDLDGIHMAIIGVEEDRHSTNNIGCAHAPDEVRANLYALCEGAFKSKIADLGNIKRGATVQDTYVALKTVMVELMQQNILPIIIGGSQDLTYAQYLAYQELEQRVDMVVIDSHFDLDEAQEDNAEEELVTSISYLNKIILHEPNNLFNFSNIGYQSYFVPQQSIRLMDKLYFDVHRLGEFTGNLPEAEPILRNANLLSIDVSAIRQSDAPANAKASPNGFYGQEVCQLCRYAGYNDKLLSIGFYELNIDYDRDNQTAHLFAQMIWCFIEGFYSRKNDHPANLEGEFTKYRTFLRDENHEIIFFKSQRTDRWWMQVPYPGKLTKNERNHLVPCSYKDYQLATNGEMPDRWWKTYQKLG